MNTISGLVKFLAACSLLYWLSSCQASKPIETEIRVSIAETLPVHITKDAGATFITFYPEEEYRKIFLDELKRLLALQKIVVDNNQPQFAISFTALDMNETTARDTVKDEKSKDHGKVFDVAVAKLNATGTLINLSNQQSQVWSADRDKRERVTSLQSPSQILKGENKALNEYRKKDFDKNEFLSLSGICGQEAAREISKAIRRQLK